MWQFGEVIEIGDENSDNSKQPDAKNQAFSDQPHNEFPEFMLPISDEKVKNSTFLRQL